jgi:hypothetical protein
LAEAEKRREVAEIERDKKLHLKVVNEEQKLVR